MTIFRIRYERAGNHVHCRLFSGNSTRQFQLNGGVTFSEEEFAAFQKMAPEIEYIEFPVAKYAEEQFCELLIGPFTQCGNKVQGNDDMCRYHRMRWFRSLPKDLYNQLKEKELSPEWREIVDELEAEAPPLERDPYVGVET